MDDWYKWVFSGIGVGGVTALVTLLTGANLSPTQLASLIVALSVVTALVTYLVTRAKDRTRVSFLNRSQIDHKLGTLQERCERAKSAVFISGNDCKFVVESASAYIDELLARSIRVNILAVDPNSPVPEMLEKIDPRFHSAEEFQNSMIEVMRRLSQWKQQYPTLFDYKLLPFLPALGFFIVDPTSDNGIVKIEIYTAKPWKPIDSRPHIVLSKRNREWREYFVHQWENYWELAEEGSPY